MISLLNFEQMDAADVEDVETLSPGPVDHSGEDPGALECRGRLEEMAKRDLMVDDRVIDIIKLQGLEGLYRTPPER
nr:hypothetical protein CFP56_79141 [Quercus suber]